MKNKLSILLSLILVCLLAVTLTVAALAEGEEEQTITVSYMNDQDTTSDTTSLDKTAYTDGKQTVGVGEKFTLPTTSSNTYAGKDGFQLVWYTEDGRTYKAGQEVSFTKDTKLFRCVAKECYSMEDVNYAMRNESKAAILMADINTNSSIGVENQGRSVLILNGYTVNITRNGIGMGDQRSGKHIYGTGTINMTNPDGKVGNYYFFEMRSHGYNGSANKQVIGRDVTLNAPNYWLGADSDGSFNNHYPWLRIYGTVNCYGFLNMGSGNRSPFIEIFETATVTVNGPRLFSDVTNKTCNYQAFDLRIYGGTFNLPAEAATEAFWSNDNVESLTSTDGKNTYPNAGLNINNKDCIKVFGGTFNVEGGAAPAIDSFLENEYLGSIPSGGKGLLAKENTSTYHVCYMSRPGYTLAFEKYATEGTPAKLTVTDYVDGSLSGTYYYVFTTTTYDFEEKTVTTIDTITVYEDAEGTTVTDKFALDFGMNGAVLFSNAITQKEYKLQANEGSYIVVPAGCEHSYTKTVVEASCKTQGSVTYTCTLCGHSTTTITEEKGAHAYEVTSDTAATATSLGNKTFTCKDCGVSIERAYTVDPTSLEVKVTVRHDDDTFEDITVLASEVFDFAVSGIEGAYIYTLSAIKEFDEYKIRNIYGITIPKGVMYVNITTQNYEKYNNVEYGVAVLKIADGANVDISNIGNLRRAETIVVGKNADVVFGASCSYYNPNNEKRSMQVIATIDLSAGNHSVKFMPSAFSERGTVASLKLGENATYDFGNYAFNKCAITEFNFPASNEYNFGSYAFYGNDMTELVFPDNKDFTLPQSAFENCPNLTSITFGENSTYVIGNYCFLNCPIPTVVFSANSTYTVGTQAFINKSLTTIDASAGNMILTLNNNAFNCWFSNADNANVTSIKLGPNSTYYFAKESFARTDIETLTLAENSTYTFVEYCFNNCTTIKAIDASAKGITATWNHSAMRNLSTLSSIIFGEDGNHTLKGDSFNKTGITELVLANGSTYTFNEGCFNSTSIAKIDASASNINVAFKYRAFRDEKTLAQVLINGEDSTFSFENESFYNTAITSLTLGQGSTYTFGNYPFSNTAIASVDATASNVTATFKNGVFSGKTTLEYLAFGENSTYVFETNAFNGTNPTNDIVFSNTSTFTIGKEAFKDTDFATVTFEDNVNVTFTDHSAFNNCTAKELYLGKNMKINNYPFKNFKYLEKLVIMDGVTCENTWFFENAGSADFSTPLVVYNHSTDLEFKEGMFNNCDGIVLYTVTDNIGTRNDVFKNCADGTGYKGWTVILGIPHALTQGQSDPTCTIPGGTNWVAADCGCGIVYREELSINVYENKHNIKADTEPARVDTYATDPISPLGHTKGDFITIVYENGYLESGYAQYTCPVCANAEGYYEEEANPIIVNYGYSVSTYGDAPSIVQGYGVDVLAFNAYKAVCPSFAYGIVIAGNSSAEAVSPLKVENGQIIKNNSQSIIKSFNDTPCDYFDIKLSFLTDKAKEQTLIFCAYIYDGIKLQYVENGKAVDAVTGNTFNNIESSLAQ